MKAQITIETINNILCTVVRKPFDYEWALQQLRMTNEVKTLNVNHEFSEYIFSTKRLTYDDLEYIRRGDWEADMRIVTILPALPKHPKPEDAPLLYRYMAEGLYPTTDEGLVEGFCPLDKDWTLSTGCVFEVTITHATLDGERVEIAIE